MSAVQGPARRPCPSCPYRRDVPSGVWEPDEYAKLPPYDEDTPNQPVGVFLCHQQDGRVCAGWCGTHDMTQNLAVRVAVMDGRMGEATVDAVLDYATDVPLHPSGAAAAAHGLAGVQHPGPDARAVIDKISRRRTPKRIQRRREKGWRMPDGAVYVGRGSRWGNPYVVGSNVVITAVGCKGEPHRQVLRGISPSTAVALYRVRVTVADVNDSPFDPGRLRWDELAGKDLACWCPEGQPCHADVLLEIANGAS